MGGDSWAAWHAASELQDYDEEFMRGAKDLGRDTEDEDECLSCQDSGWAEDDNAAQPLWRRKPCSYCDHGKLNARRVEMAAEEEGERLREEGK